MKRSDMIEKLKLPLSLIAGGMLTSKELEATAGNLLKMIEDNGVVRPWDKESGPLRIAFDCMGTINGPKQKFVIGLMKFFHEMGHEVFIWSNSYSIAVQASRDVEAELGITFTPRSKWANSDSEERVDIAVDDDSNQTWLAAKRFIWVHDIPAAMGGVKKLAEEVGKPQ